MKSYNYIWNRKPFGFFLTCYLFCGSLYNRIGTSLVSFFCKHGFGSCGNNIIIHNHFVCRYPRNVFLKDDVSIGYGAELSSEFSDSELHLDKGVSIGKHCYLDFSGGVTICEYAHIAHNVRVITHDHGDNYLNKPVGKPLKIMENAFIGSDSIILYNVNAIGKCSVIGAGSVVTKAVPDYAVVAGNPAKVIRYIK